MGNVPSEESRRDGRQPANLGALLQGPISTTSP